MEKEINDKISELKRRRKEFGREAQKFKEDIDREVRNLRKQLYNNRIKVGDFVETTERYRKELTTQKPFSGIVIDVIKRRQSGNLIIVKNLNGRKDEISEYWLQKKEVNPICRVIFSIITDKKKIEKEIKLFDIVRTTEEYNQNCYGKPFTGIVIKIDDYLVTVKCMDGTSEKIDILWLERC